LLSPFRIANLSDWCRRRGSVGVHLGTIELLAVLYFLVIVAAPLRLSLALVWAATLGTMAGYAFFLGYVRWRLELPIEQRLSRPQQVVFLLALGAAGLLAGQFVRQCRRLVRGTPLPVEGEVST
jgi:hypothetical protein